MTWHKTFNFKPTEFSELLLWGFCVAIMNKLSDAVDRFRFFISPLLLCYVVLMTASSLGCRLFADGSASETFWLIMCCGSAVEFIVLAGSWLNPIHRRISQTNWEHQIMKPTRRIAIKRTTGRLSQLKSPRGATNGEVSSEIKAEWMRKSDGESFRWASELSGVSCSQLN